MFLMGEGSKFLGMSNAQEQHFYNKGFAPNQHTIKFKYYYQDLGIKVTIDKVMATPAWQRKEGKNPEGGLNAKGRASYNAKGGNLKPPVSREQAKKSPKSAKRRKSFCARMRGMKRKLTSAKTANDPNSRINKSLRKWDC